MQSNHVVISTAINTSLFDSTCILGSAGLQVFMLLTGSVPIEKEKLAEIEFLGFWHVGCYVFVKPQNQLPCWCCAKAVLLCGVTNQLPHFCGFSMLLFSIAFPFSKIKILINQYRDQICMLNGAPYPTPNCHPQSVIGMVRMVVTLSLQRTRWPQAWPLLCLGDEEPIF